MTACSGFFASNYANFTKIRFIRVHSMPLLLTLRKPWEGVHGFLKVAFMTACSVFWASNYANSTKIGGIRVHSMPLLLTLRKPLQGVYSCPPAMQNVTVVNCTGAENGVR
jgi:hypothetical protein